MTALRPTTQALLSRHYQSLARDYDRFLYYSPEFVRSLTAMMIHELRLEVDDVLADIGCGSGMYSLDILEQVPLAQPVVGVDPFPEMLEQIPADANVEKVAMDALKFSTRPGGYNKVLIKETIHHVEDRATLFANLSDRLPGGGTMCLVHVPPEVEYPLFDAALQRCHSWHADPDELAVQLNEAGFVVDSRTHEYEHSIPRADYLKMVEARYMSVLTSFSDEELVRGLDEIDRRYSATDPLVFIDRFSVVTADKPADA